jgi:outer membrane lipoprotein-sorting protein
MKSALLVISLALLLAGCGESAQNTPPPAKLFVPQRDALDKAKGVEQTVKQQAEEQKQDVEGQTE